MASQTRTGPKAETESVPARVLRLRDKIGSSEVSKDKTIVLITGANGGIGYELARQLLSDSTKHILLCSRSLYRGEQALKSLLSLNLPGTVELLLLDVSSFDSIQTAFTNVLSIHGKLHALVNNAAVATNPGDIPLHEWMTTCFITNALGPHMMVETFGPLLAASSTPSNPSRIINVTSGAGSITRRMDSSSPHYKLKVPSYRASKAALNMISSDQAVEYEDHGVKVFLYSPRFVVSNLGPHNKAENGAMPTSAGARPMVEILEGKRDGEHGCFLIDGGQYPW